MEGERGVIGAEGPQGGVLDIWLILRVMSRRTIFFFFFESIYTRRCESRDCGNAMRFLPHAMSCISFEYKRAPRQSHRS